jgi:hypothetical protein
VLTATQQVVTTATQTFNQLTVPIPSGQVFDIKFKLPYNLTGSSNGIRIGLLFPAARTARFGVHSLDLAGAATPLFSIIKKGGPLSVLITSGTATAFLIIDGVLLCSGSGNLIPFIGSEVANATAQVMPGGTVIAWNLGAMTV